MTQVYNISFQIDPNMQEQWVLWMKSKFIPMIIATDCFVDHKFYELAITQDQAPTYTLQLFAQTPEKLTQYQDTHSTVLLDEMQASWGEQCFHFVTTMQIVN